MGLESALKDAEGNLYKVVLIDNFNRDTVSDRNLKRIGDEPVESEYLTQEAAKALADRYNDKYLRPNSDWYAVVKPQSYKLYEGNYC